MRVDADAAIFDLTVINMRFRCNRHQNMREDDQGASCDATVMTICALTLTTQNATRPPSPCARRR